MIVSIAELVILGFIVDWAFRRLNVPGLIGMLLLGVAFGPFVLGWISPDLHTVSGDFRMIALIVILLRAGLGLSRETLNRIGGRALLLAIVPAITEGLAVTVLGPPLLGLSYMESAVLGSILAAVSPAVVVPLMIGFTERGMGVAKGIPTMVLAASAANDVFVIVIYGVLIGIYTGDSVNLTWQLAGIPISIVLGLAAGLFAGYALVLMFRTFEPRATKRVLVVLGVSVLLVRAENLITEWLPFAALLAVMAMGFFLLEKDEIGAHKVSAKLGKIWIFAEIVLFTIVGAQVDLNVAWTAGLAGAAIIALGLVARSIGTYGCLLGNDFNRGERIFVVVAYLPKATVQAAIGGAPLVALAAAGMAIGPGHIILAVAVLSIMLTAPIGAWATAIAGEKFLIPDVNGDDAARRAIVESAASDERL